MITTDFVPGSPYWIDLGVPDVQAAARFYGGVFGWEHEPMGEDSGGYGFFRKDGEIVGAVGKLDEEGAEAGWMLYFHVPDASAATEAVRGAGGIVRLAPTGIEGAGRFAQFTDPQGGQFAVFQPEGDVGLERVDKPDSLCWIELCTSDVEAAKEFYRTLFGWQIQGMPMPGGGGTYWITTPAGLADERMTGGLVESDGQPNWHPVFEVDDCDATAAKVTADGGTLTMGPDDAEGVGRLAVCEDPFGAEFVLLTPAERS